jgi:glutaredoxin
MRLFTRRGCRLCEEAEDMLAGLGHHAEIIDVDAAADAASRYGLRVPVLEIDGLVVAEGRFLESDVARGIVRVTARG